jgi:hypothetical protein
MRNANSSSFEVLAAVHGGSLETIRRDADKCQELPSSQICLAVSIKHAE